jgi:hypothetical protein
MFKRGTVLNRKIPVFLAMLFTAGLLLSGPAAAAKIPTSLRLGKVHVVPILGLDVSHTTNIFLSQGDEAVVPKQSDTVTTLQYGLEFVLPASDWLFSLGGRGLTHWYTDFSELDNTDVELFGTIEADFPGGFGFTIKDTYDIAFLLPSNEFGPGEDYRYNELVVDARYDFYQDFRIRLQYTNNYINYDETVERDRMEQAIAGWLYRKIASKTALSIGAAYVDYDYDDNVEGDNTATEVNAGVTWGATAKSTGRLQAGYEWKDYTQEKDNGEYWTLAGGWNYRFNPKTSMSFTLERGTEETSFVDNPWYLNSSIEAELRRTLSKRFYFEAFGEIWKDDYPNVATYRGETAERADDSWRLRGTLGMNVYRNVSVAVNLEQWERDSNFNSLDYDETIFYFSIRAGLALDYERPRRRY